LQTSLFDECDMAAVTSPDIPGEQLILGSSPRTCHNSDLARERHPKLLDLVPATENNRAAIATALCNAAARQGQDHPQGRYRHQSAINCIDNNQSLDPIAKLIKPTDLK